MTDRITRADLAAALKSHKLALEACGVKYDGQFVLEEGSKTYGRAYRLYRVPEGQSGHYNPPVGGDYLGMTAREAYENLTTRTSVLWDVATALRGGES